MRRGNRGKWKVILLAGNQSLRALTLFRRYESMSLRQATTRRAGLPGPWEIKKGSAWTKRSRLRFLVLGCYTAPSGATEAFATIEAFVTSPVADGDMPAIGACRGILLEVGNGVAKGCNRPSMD